METSSRIPGFYPQTPAASTSNPRFPVNGHFNPDNQNSPLGSIGRAGGPIRRTPAVAHSRARAHSTPYARPPQPNVPGSGSRHRTEEDEHEEEVLFLRNQTDPDANKEKYR